MACVDTVGESVPGSRCTLAPGSLGNNVIQLQLIDSRAWSHLPATRQST
jgi:hypothetical protein